MKSEIDITAGIQAERFEAMRFDTRNGPKGSSAGKRLGSQWIFKSVFLTSWQRICKGIKTADWSKPKSAKSLYNDVTWPNMGIGLRIAIGRCLRHFVDNEMLPLRVINPKSTGTKFYELVNQ
jgi:hypothetical protein